MDLVTAADAANTWSPGLVATILQVPAATACTAPATIVQMLSVELAKLIEPPGEVALSGWSESPYIMGAGGVNVMAFRAATGFADLVVTALVPCPFVACI
jgi:hypothetical protein